MNKKIILSSIPQGRIKLSDFQLTENPITTKLNPGEVLVRVEYVSVDPQQRGKYYIVWISDHQANTHHVQLGETIISMGVGCVTASRSPAYKRGNYVSGLLGWQEFAIVHASSLTKLPSYESPQLYLGVLGIPGLTAYFAVTEIAKLQKKNVMVVSSAAGAVGSIACQIGKMKDCKVIGICGSDEKINWLMNTVKIDGCINYKKQSLKNELMKLCPDGIDVYFDNVGGKTLDSVLRNIKKGARVVLCGTISSYNNKEDGSPIRYYPQFLYRIGIPMSATFEGFVIWDYKNRFDIAIRQLNRWLQEKKIIFKEHIVYGLKNAPRALQMVMNGENFGKMIVKVAKDQPLI